RFPAEYGRRHRGRRGPGAGGGRPPHREGLRLGGSEGGYGNGGTTGGRERSALDAPLESLAPLPVRGATAPHDRPGPARAPRPEPALPAGALPAGALPVPDSYPPDAYPHDTAAYRRDSHAEGAHDRGTGEPGAFATEPFLPGQAVPEPRKDTTFKE
ncbi:hypothetical protein ABZ708_35915, partial [Streptomyces sp. NPDC006863]